MGRLLESKYSKAYITVTISFMMILGLAVGIMTWSIFTPKGHFKGTQGELSAIYEPYVHQLERGVEKNEKSREK